MAEHDERTLEQDGDEAAEQRSRLRKAALESVRQWGDPVLRSVAGEVTVFDQSLAAEAERMVDLMDAAAGVGLAAPQVGSLKRMFVYRVDPEEPASVLVNPRIVWSSDEEEVGLEGCLSLVDGEFALQIARAVKVRVEAQGIEGEPIEIEAEGLEARVIQHENDHLDGVLILDRAEPEERRDALRSLREASSAAIVR